MIEPIASNQRPLPPYSLCRHATMLEAFRELKRYDRNVAESDPFLIRAETAWRDKDADDIMTLLTAALAERVLGY